MKKIILLLLGLISLPLISALEPAESMSDLANMMIIDLGNRINSLTKQQAAQQKIKIEPLNKQYLSTAKRLTKDMPKMKPAVARLFNVIETIDDNLNNYLNNPSDVRIKELLDGALASCVKVKNMLLDIAREARMQNNEELRETANLFWSIAEKVIATTESLMAKATPTQTPKKSKNIFKRIFGS